MMKKKKGFTLVEIMIVVAIIGLIAAIAIPNYIGYMKRAKRGACVANMVTIAKAAEAYLVEQKIEADDLAGLADDVVEDKLTTVSEYLKKIPDCGAGGTYSYTENAADGVFVVDCSWTSPVHPACDSSGERE